VTDGTTSLDTPENPPLLSFDLQKICKADGEEFLVILTNKQEGLKRLSVSVLPVEPSLAEGQASVFVGYASSGKLGCGKAEQDGASTLEGCEIGAGEKMGIWILCEGPLPTDNGIEYSVKINEMPEVV
jgi:hypothetical protein